MVSRFYFAISEHLTAKPSIQILDRKLEGLNVSNYTTKNMPFKKILNMFLINKKLVLFNFEMG